MFRYVEGGSPPVMSTGLPAAPNGGMNFRNAASRSSGMLMSVNPLSTQAWSLAFAALFWVVLQPLWTFDAAAGNSQITTGPLSEPVDGQPRSAALTTTLDTLSSTSGGAVSFTTLRLVYNPGAAFGLAAGFTMTMEPVPIGTSA